jgi:sugar (glycoside-pentoside-hexuronide) transporter
MEEDSQLLSAKTEPPLSLGTKLAFGFGEMAGAITHTMTGFFLNAYFLEVVEMSPTSAATILFLGRAWDAITDPLIGFLSDRTDTRWGRRKPWMVGSVVPSTLSFLALWYSFQTWQETEKLLYYLFIWLLYQTAQSCYYVPYSSMTPDLHPDDVERTKATNIRMSFGMLCLIVGGLSMSFILDFFPESQDFGYFLGALVISPLMLFPALVTCAVVKLRPQPKIDALTLKAYLSSLILMGKNKPFVFLLLMYSCSTTANVIIQGNLLLFCKYSLNLADHFSYLLACVVSFTIIVMALVTLLLRRFPKKFVYAFGLIPSFAAFASTMWVPAENVFFLYPLGILAGSGFAVTILLPWVMLPDVVDYDEATTGLRREGQFYSFFVFFQKIGSGIALALSNLVIQAGGYNQITEDLPWSEVPNGVKVSLRALMGPIPATLYLLTYVFLYFYQLDKETMNRVAATLRSQHKEKSSKRGSSFIPHSFI